MALKQKVTADEFSKLVPALQGEYKQDGEGYSLDIIGYEDPSKVLAAKNHERDQRKLAEQSVRDLTKQLEDLTAERDGMLAGSIPKADAEKLQKSWETKLANKEKELTGQIEAANASLQKLLVDNVAQSIASDISTAPAVIMPHIKGRLKAEKNAAGEFVTVVVDKDGKPSALTVDELKKEFVLHPDFKAIITGSKASGGGAGGGGSGGGAGAGKIDWNQPASALKTQLEGRLVEPGQPLKR
jgi:hypothetical protein